jgi:serine/threonine protein kinase
MDGDEPVLFDFGLSYIEEMDKDKRPYVGSPLYMAPEVLLEQGYDPYLVDLWGLGIILFALAQGEEPNSDVTDLDVLIERINTNRRIDHTASPLLAPLLDGLLNFDAEKRWSLTKVQEYISSHL